jgi:hypothetical protein
MSRSKQDAHHRVAAGVGCAAVAAGLFLFLPRAADAQNRPPLQEPIALEGTMKQFYRGANVVIVTTMDGVEHVYQFTKNLIVHGGKKPGVDALGDCATRPWSFTTRRAAQMRPPRKSTFLAKKG